MPFKNSRLPFRKSRLWKVILSIVAVGMLPLAGGFLLAVLHGESTLIAVTGEKFKDMSKQLSLHLDFLIDREIHEGKNLALSKQLREAVVLSDSKEESGLRPIQSLLESEASKHLQDYLNLKEGEKEDEYEIIFVTDRAGEVVASTASPPQRNYAEEPWWQATYHHGEGAVYLGDLTAGQESNSLRTGLGVPIFDSQGKQAIGVIKFVIKEMEVGEILHEVAVGKTGHAMLLREDGAVLICTLFPPALHQPIQIDKNLREGWSIQPGGHGGEETVVGFSVVSSTDLFGSQPFGIKPWRVVVTQTGNELFAPIHRALWLFSGFGGALAGVLILLGIFAGEKVIRPILVIQQGAEILARGDLTHRLEMSTGDELETLANTINTMAENLDQRTTELLANRDYLKNIIDQSAAFIITSDPTYKIKEFNRGAEEVFGYQRDSIIGKELELLWEDPQDFQQVMSEVAAKGQRVSYETVFARSDESPVAVSCSLTQIKDQGGAVVGLVLVGEDLTERKELAESRFQAERLMSLYRLSTVLTHDLRSPLVGILKALTLLQMKYGKMPEDQARQLLSDLVRGGDLLLGTLNDLLDVYRHSLSAIPLRYTDFVLAEAIEEVVRLLDLDAETQGVRLEAAPLSSKWVLSADRRRIQRVIFNLIDNAIKYSPSGGRVVVSVRSVGEEWIDLRVEDQGPGIPEEEISEIFHFLYHNPGSQIDRPERGGAGVGLYFCRVTVEAHGGRIWAENRPEGGARFIVQLPLVQRSLQHG